MSIVEATKNMLDVLPESDVKVIYAVTKNIFDKEASLFRPLTREQILSDLAVSRREIENGDYLDADAAIAEIEGEYGL